LGLLQADAFQNGMRTEAVGQFANSLDGLAAALADDVGRAELLCECNAVGITTKEDDALGA